MKKIAILFAMKEEGKYLIEKLKATLIEDKFYKIYFKKNIYIVISKIGLINAAICLCYLEQNYKIDYYINAGLVGTSNSSLKQLQAVKVDKVFLGNADASGFGYALGQIPQMPAHYQTENNLLNKFNNLVNVNICSSDVFINNLEKFNLIVKPIDDSIKIFDMECFGFYQAAYIFKKPIIAIKIISDTLDKKNNEKQFNEILDQASLKISKIILDYLEKEKNNEK